MVFTVLVAADVYGTKGNFEVTFPSQPALAELTRQTESIYGVEAAARRPVGTIAAPFLVSRFQIYNERLQQWVDLSSANQLTDRCQVFAFQSSAPGSVAASSAAAADAAAFAHASQANAAAAAQQNAHNAAVATAAANAAMATHQHQHHQQQQQHAARAAAASAAAARQQAAMVPSVPATVVQMPAFSDTATHEDKTRAVFEGLDTNGNRVLEPEEVRQAFELLHVDFSGATISDLIAKADADRDGVVAYPEWQRFSERFPTLIDSFYFRLKAYWEDVRRQQEIRASKEMLAELKERAQQAQVDWLEAQRDSDAARSRLSAQEIALVQAIDAQRAAEQCPFPASYEGTNL
ncbi:flagellar protein essential for flagellar pocket biogenesis [Diplonema papillatum]|nr:flagellar protein essential for flagellar pocket biogenesis [Diplonema papillatum]